MSAITKKVTNGVSIGVKHTITASDVSDGSITFTFTGVNYAFGVVIYQTNSSGVFKDQTGLIVTYPSSGKVTLTDGGANFTSGDILTVMCVRNPS